MNLFKIYNRLFNDLMNQNRYLLITIFKLEFQYFYIILNK